MKTAEDAKSMDQSLSKQKGGKSKTSYPYYDLDQSIQVAKAIRDNAGGVCTGDQLAVYLEYSSTRSGTYFSRVNAAKLFGLIQQQGENLSLTERGTSILSPVMPDDEIRGRLDAFLSVPLFSAVYEQFKGQALPPEVGIKNLLKTRFGIVEDRVTPALRVLMDSAEQAGLFKTTGDRSKMIKSVVTESRTPESKTPPEGGGSPERIEKPKGGGGDNPPPGIHTAIVGLLRELPAAGTSWPSAKKQRFLDAFKAIVDVVYPDTEDTP